MIAACSLATVEQNSWAIMSRSLCPLTISVFTKTGTAGCATGVTTLIDKRICEVEARRKRRQSGSPVRWR